MLDQLDNRILRYLQNDPESSVAKLAEKAAKTLTERKGEMKFAAPKSYLEFEKARKELQSNISKLDQIVCLNNFNIRSKMNLA